MKGSGIYVRYVHGYLGNAVFVYVPADCLGAFEGAGNPAISAGILSAFFTDVEGNCHGAAGAGGVEVEVHGHKEAPGAHVCGTGLLCNGVPLAAEIRLAGFV